MSKKPSIFHYLEYPDFLSAWFEYQKEVRYGFSYRSFSRTAGIDSPNYLQRIITRQRKLSEKYLPLIAAGVGLNKSELAYLTLLVQIEQCRDDRSREALTAQMVQLRAERSSGKLTAPMLHYLSRWFYPVLREMIVLYQTADPQILSRKICPEVSQKDVTAAVQFLLENDYISENEGVYSHTTPILTTGDEIVSTIVNRFHRESLLLSVDDLTNSPAEKRDISSLILSLSEESFSRVKKEIQQFRKRLLQISEEDKSPDRVYHLGFQLLPRTNQNDSTNTDGAQ